MGAQRARAGPRRRPAELPAVHSDSQRQGGWGLAVNWINCVVYHVRMVADVFMWMQVNGVGSY